MKFTLAWLKEHLDTNADLNTIVDRLTVIGLEVELVKDRAKGLEPFIVGQVLNANQHPDADRLRVCSVDTGDQEFQVVCGAPNAKAGMKGVFAPVGSYIPGTGITLKRTEIRGVESCGMLLSEREMGISDEHEGIVDLPEDSPIGALAIQVMGLDDPIIEIAITPNRGDCLGIRGIARDLAAAGLGTIKPLEAIPIPGRFDSPIGVVLDFPDKKKDACPYFIGRYLRGVKNGPSPAWVQDKLVAVGLRPISALVDITNLMTIEFGRPLHVFDAAKVKGNVRPRMARADESLLALDGKMYAMDEEMCVIGDDVNAEALGGIMGGESSGCTEETTDVFIECAYFDPMRTAMTGRKLNLQSDARFRFERGVDPEFMEPAMEIATQHVLDLCGGEASNLVIAGAVPDWKRTITLRLDRVRSLGGVELSADEISSILGALGFVHAKTEKNFDITPPSWRPDIVGEACLVEEVIRMYGYDKIPAVPMALEGAMPNAARTLDQTRRFDGRRILASRGMTEAVTYSFLAEKDAMLFGSIPNSIKLTNPISSDLSVMRSSILPNLINAAVRNAARGILDTAIFEVGPQFAGDQPADQTTAASGIRTGNDMVRHWLGNPRVVDAFDAKADVTAVLNELGIATDRLQVSPQAPSYFHPGRSGSFQQGPKNTLAHFGEVHPRVLKAMDIPGPVAAFEIFLDNVTKPKRKKDAARPHLSLSAFQRVSRDFAFVINEDVTAEMITSAANKVDKELITETDVFDVFAGGNLEEGKKSMALSITLQPMDRTLTDAEIEEVAKKVVASVTKATGAALRM